jgi:hypothetical protein
MHPHLLEIPSDRETATLLRLLSSAVSLLGGASSPYEPPGWVEDFGRNPRYIEFTGREGADSLKEWLRQSEERIETLLRRNPLSLLRVLGILRRLPNDRFLLGERQEEGGVRRFNPYHANVAECAALKYAQWDAAGVAIEDWSSELPGLAQDRPSIDAESIAEVLALIQHASVGLAHVDDLRKTVVRGGAVIVRPDGVSDARQEPGLRQRLHLYDERRQEFSFIGGTAGTFHPSDARVEPGEKSVPCVSRTTYREDEGREPWRYERSRRSIPRWDKRFGFAVVDLQPAYEYMKLLEEEVTSQYGFSPEMMVSALTAMHRLVVDHFLAPPNGRAEELIPERLAFLDRRGYLLVREDVMNTYLSSWTLEALEEIFPDFPNPSNPERFAHSFKRLAYLDSYSRGDLSLTDGFPWVRNRDGGEPPPMPPPFVYPAGSHRIVDLKGIRDFVQGLFDCLVLDEEPRRRLASNLEQRLGDYLERELPHPQAFEPSKELWIRPAGENRRTVAELDTSVRVGSVLIAIDAKSIRISSRFRRYEHAALRNRWQNFVGHVAHADEQARNLSRQPRGTNYDLVADGYTHVVTLLCSSTPEFIDTDDPSFYIRRNLPRIATPLELRNFLSETTEDELRALPYARSISR